ncbi:hypothetical protein ACFL07_04095 [Pseudomonadota bacterium]
MTLTKQLQGVPFEWKESGEPSFGFIAEEVAFGSSRLLHCHRMPGTVKNNK